MTVLLVEKLEAEDLLALWEQGSPLHPIDRALTVLGRAMPQRGHDELARLPLGVRDALLLQVRRETIGEALRARDACVTCGEPVEVELNCQEVIDGGLSGPPPDWWIEQDDQRIRVRALDSTDAAAAAQCDTVGTARRLLLERSVVDAERRGQSVTVEDLGSSTVDAIATSIAAHDLGVEIQLRLACPACGQRWTNTLDVASFVWTELAASAQRVMSEVDALARAYAWSEAEILAMSAPRRAAYLAMAGA